MNTAELEEAVNALVTWYDPKKHHNCKVPDVCRRGEYERVMRLVTNRAVELTEKVIGEDEVNEQPLDSKSWRMIQDWLDGRNALREDQRSALHQLTEGGGK